MTATTTSCPQCAAQAPPATAQCERCGFVFFERRRPRGRPSRRLLASVGAGLAAALAAVLLIARDDPAAAPEPPEPLSAERAGLRLERQFSFAGYDDTAAVRCARSVVLRGATRCQVRYANGDTQLVLVGLDERGELDVAIPYPAQRRPGN